MENPDFKDQYIIFFAAYSALTIGLNIYEDYGIFSSGGIFFILSFVLFVYFFKTTIARLIDRIKEGKVTVCNGIIQYMKEFIFCIIMSWCWTAVLELGKKYVRPLVF